MYCSVVTFELFVINFSTEQHRRILKDGEDEPEHGICNLCLIDANATCESHKLHLHQRIFIQCGHR